MAIPRVQTNMVDLANLQPGVRYSFRTNANPANISEGTFVQFIAPGNFPYGQYIFSNYAEYNPQGRLLRKSGIINCSNPNNYPRDIFVYDLSNLPNELNQHIRSFGGSKSRKNKKSKKNRKSRKSRKSRKNKKSKK